MVPSNIVLALFEIFQKKKIMFSKNPGQNEKLIGTPEPNRDCPGQTKTYGKPMYEQLTYQAVSFFVT